MPFCVRCGKEIEEGIHCEECKKVLNEIEEEKYGQASIESNNRKSIEKTLNIISSILYPSILVILSFVFQDNVTYLSLAVLCAIGSGILSKICGLYVIIIPLFVFNLFRVGCAKSNIPMVRKVIFIICSILLVFCSILFMSL